VKERRPSKHSRKTGVGGGTAGGGGQRESSQAVKREMEAEQEGSFGGEGRMSKRGVGGERQPGGEAWQ